MEGCSQGWGTSGAKTLEKARALSRTLTLTRMLMLVRVYCLWQELKKLVQLHQERFVAFEQPPLSEYDLYQRKLRSNTSIAQKGSQSNEDDRTVDTQTDEVGCADSEIQFQLGDDTQFENLLSAMQSGQEGLRQEALDGLLEKREVVGNAVGTNNLSHFLQHASQAVESLLVENFASAEESKDAGALPSSKDMSSAFQQDAWHVAGVGGFSEHPLMTGRTPSWVCCNPSQGSTILTICNELPGQLSSDKLAGKAVLLVWDAASPDYPVNVLVGDGNPTCASFSPNQNFIVFAGTEDGNLLVWDLREARTAQTIELAEELGLHCPVRFAAYSTRSMAVTTTQIHTSRIVSVAPMPSLAASRGQLSFQIVSSDDRGLVSFWLLSELTQAETETVFDLGIQIGSSIRLVRSRSLSIWGSMDVVPRPPGRKGGPGQPLDLDTLSMDMLLDSLGPGPTVQGLNFYPGDANQFLVRLYTAGFQRASLSLPFPLLKLTLGTPPRPQLGLLGSRRGRENTTQVTLR
mmetsp:Transcript_105651/g.305413  ORF Transcript_105651/g.305413 Transcript_105651/m.305413 type:complete len:518 (+) Transcript_105651:924-2477(+)